MGLFNLTQGPLFYFVGSAPPGENTYSLRRLRHGDYQSQKSFTTPMMEPSTPLYSGPQPSITDTYGEGFPGQMIESGQRNKDDRGSEQQGNDIC
jgi:hypothetical protein